MAAMARKWKKLGKELLLIAGIGTLWSALNIRDWNDPENITLTIIVTIGIWILMWKGNQWVVTLIEPRISWVKEPTKRLVTGLIAHSVYTVAAFWIYGWLLKAIFDININYQESSIYAVGITLGIVLFLHLIDFIKSYRELYVREEKLRTEAANARFQALKNQVNPHFLFNSFNTLNSLIHTDKEIASAFVEQMSDVFRYVLDTTEENAVPLEKELKFLKSYIFLQNQRFGENLHVNIGDINLKKTIPPLSLYMLVENAIKHNVLSSNNPLLIDIRQEGSILIVSNPIKKKDIPDGESKNLGLKNIRERFRYLDRSGFNIEVVDDKFVVKMPLE